MEGARVAGAPVGVCVGSLLGWAVGGAVGNAVVGAAVSTIVGTAEGMGVIGAGVGSGVGTTQVPNTFAAVSFAMRIVPMGQRCGKRPRWPPCRSFGICASDGGTVPEKKFSDTSTKLSVSESDESAFGIVPVRLLP